MMFLANLLLLLFAYSVLVALVCLASAISEALEDKPAQHVAKRDDAFLVGLLRNLPAIRVERNQFHAGGNARG